MKFSTHCWRMGARALPAVAVVTVLIGFTYTAVQQDFRLSANDPQIEMTEDAVTALNAGAVDPRTLANSFLPIDLSESLAPYMAIFDASSTLLISSATLQGKPLSLPKGVFDYVKTHGEDRITWQPMLGVRSAIVVVPFNGGFLLVGRSLREVEARIAHLGLFAFLAWLALVAVIVCTAWWREKFRIE